MDPQLADAAIVLLVLKEAGVFARVIIEAVKPKKSSASDSRLASAIEALNKTVATMHAASDRHHAEATESTAILTALDQSHHGPSALDRDNRYRWHGAELAEELKALRRDTKTGHAAIVTAIQASPPGP